MSNIRMLLKNLWDEASLSVTLGTPVVSLPISYSQTYGRSLTAGITPDGSGRSAIEFNLNAFHVIDGLVIYRHWLSTGASWRLELFEDVNCSGFQVFDSGEIEAVPTKTLGELMWLSDPLVASIFESWPYKFSQIWLPMPVSAQSGRITLVDVQSRDGIHEFDRIYLGQSLSPAVNFSWGAEHAWQSNEQLRRSVAGSLFGTEKQRLRQMTFELGALVEEERPHLSEGIRHVGLVRDWFISLHPDRGGQHEIDYAMACKFTSLPALIGTAFNNYQSRITVQEA